MKAGKPKAQMHKGLLELCIPGRQAKKIARHNDKTRIIILYPHGIAGTIKIEKTMPG